MFEIVEETRHDNVECDEQQDNVSPRHSTPRPYPPREASQIAQKNRDRAAAMAKVRDDEAREEHAEEYVDINREVRQER